MTAMTGVLLFTLLCSALLFTVPGSTLAQPSLIRIATEGAYPPFNYVNDAGELTGFDVDIATALCRAMDRQCTIASVAWGDLLEGLAADQFDLVVASMAKTPQRERFADFVGPYYRSRSGYIGRKGSFTSADAACAAGKTLATEMGTVQADHLAAGYGASCRITLTRMNAELFALLASGEADLILTDTLTALEFLKSEEGAAYDFIGDPLPTSDPSSSAYIAVGKGKARLAQAVEEALKAIRLSGEYQRINRKYFPFSIY